MKTFLFFTASIITIFVLILFVEILLARQASGPSFTNPTREIITVGNKGPKLRYVVMGDSTGAGQGAPYDQGIAMASARHLAEKNQIEMVNLSKSGARSADVLYNQVEEAVKLKPNLVLISVAANDSTHGTPPWKVRDDLEKIANVLVAANCEVKLVYTGSPDMGTSSRFARPLRDILTFYSSLINKQIYPWVESSGYTLAPIARDTSYSFRNDQSLFDSDRFHPNARGYEVWLKTINPAIDRSLEQPKHC